MHIAHRQPDDNRSGSEAASHNARAVREAAFGGRRNSITIGGAGFEQLSGLGIAALTKSGRSLARIIHEGRLQTTAGGASWDMKRGSWGWWRGRAKESQSSEIQTVQFAKRTDGSAATAAGADIG